MLKFSMNCRREISANLPSVLRDCISFYTSSFSFLSFFLFFYKQHINARNSVSRISNSIFFDLRKISENLHLEDSLRKLKL
jgi:hypothetical protein